MRGRNSNCQEEDALVLGQLLMEFAFTGARAENAACLRLCQEAEPGLPPLELAMRIRARAALFQEPNLPRFHHG